MGSMKLNAIKEYLSKIDFKNDDWSIHQMSKDMQIFLGETPAIDVKYQKDVMIAEITGEAKEIKKIVGINIVYTDDDNKIKKFEILV